MMRTLCVELHAPAQLPLRLSAGIAHGAVELGGASPGGAQKVGRVKRRWVPEEWRVRAARRRIEGAAGICRGARGSRDTY